MKTFKKIALCSFAASSIILLVLIFIGAYLTDNKMLEQLKVVNEVMRYYVLCWIGIALMFIASLSKHNSSDA